MTALAAAPGAATVYADVKFPSGIIDAAGAFLGLDGGAQTVTEEKITTGPNGRAVGTSIAGIGPGIPDEALAPGEELPEPPSDEEVQRIAAALGAPLDSQAGPDHSDAAD